MKIRNLLFLLVTMSLSFSAVQAQQMSWRKHRKLAEQLEKEGDYYAAAENYRMAWEQKQSKEELIYKAAEIYYRMNDYRKAAAAYQHVPANYDDDQLVLLKYARALKRDGQYGKARKAFQDAGDKYTGPDKAILQDIVKVELQGLDLTNDMASRMDRRMEILHPGSTVNSDSDDFAPVAISDDQVYFTSTIGGQARIYETRRQGTNWTKAANPTGFPVVTGGQYANGTMSPDDQRFYFTICNNDGGWNGFNTRCEIYVTKRSANGWTAPERLPDFINVKGVNTTTPGVAHANGQEFLYFASNREGGRGGLDLWYVTRDLGTDNMDYTFPVNLGPVVNSLGDEITPFYSSDEGTLYFASNGHPSIGGLDIFKSNGGEVSWSVPENLGLPVNSSANDMGYVRKRSGFGGYFTSNRAFGGEKINTLDQDVFEFSTGGRQITLKANVYDQASGGLLENVSVSLYQVADDGSENLLITKDFANGSYLFELLPNRRFRVDVERAGYQPGGYVFATDDPATFAYGQPLFLQADAVPTTDPMNSGGDNPVVDNGGFPDTNPNNNGGFMNENLGTDPTTRPTGTPGAMMGLAGEEYTANGTSAKDNLAYTSTAKRYQGRYFRIQVSAVSSFNPGGGRFSNLNGQGEISTEYISSRGLTRVLVGDYFSEAEATTALQQVQGMYPSAYIVQYTDGVRYGRVNL